MTEWTRVRLDWVTTERRQTVDPAMLGCSTVFHYSIPALDELGDGRVEAPETIGSRKLLLSGGELLISKLNPRIPRVLMAEAHAVPTLASTEFISLCAGPEVEPRFLRYFLNSERLRQDLNGATVSVTRSQQRVRPELVTKAWLYLPRLPTQHAIAEFLDAETARIDALIEKKQRTVELLRERFDSLVWAEVTGQNRKDRKRTNIAWLESIPRDWGTPTVSANFDIQLGKMLDAAAASGPDQFVYLRNQNVQWDHLDLDDLASMNFDAGDRRRFELRAGDLLVCEGGEVGRAAVWQDEIPNCFYQKAIHRVRARHDQSPRYLMYCLRAAAKRSVFAVEGNLSTIVHLTREQLSVHRFPLPPAEEQLAIVERLDAAAQVTNAAASTLMRQIALLHERRQALITGAVTGDIQVPGVAA